MPFVAAWGEAAAGTGVGPAGLLEGGAGALADLKDVDGASAPDSQGAAGLVAHSWNYELHYEEPAHSEYLITRYEIFGKSSTS